MNWENLNDNRCPHCGAELKDNVLEFKCMKCTFIIDSDRKEQIQKHRAHPGGNTVKIKWQNLRDERCPICGGNLNYGIGPFEILACMKDGCTFKIRYDRLAEILNDAEHSCNKFYDREKQKIHGLNELQ